MKHVYGGQGGPDSNAVEVLVLRVRRKIGASRIQTRRGHGYVIAGEAA
jgi:two-component system OmpR family response regulator